MSDEENVTPEVPTTPDEDEGVANTPQATETSDVPESTDQGEAGAENLEEETGTEEAAE